MKALLALLLLTVPASATVTYDFQGQGYFPQLSLVVQDTTPLDFKIVSNIVYGDLGGFESFSMAGPYPQTFSSDLIQDYGTLFVNLVFNQDGTLSGVLDSWGRDQDVSISGSGSTWTGTWNYDVSTCGNLGCPLVGTFVDPPDSVPEVSSLLLLVSGLLLWRIRWIRRYVPFLG